MRTITQHKLESVTEHPLANYTSAIKSVVPILTYSVVLLNQVPFNANYNIA